jgi:hypothetical protein
MRMFAIMVAALSIAGLVLAGCGFATRTATVRFRLTIEVDTPDGVRTGSGVIQNTLVESVLPKFEDLIAGEAIEVDLGQKGSLFLLVDGMGSLANELFIAFDRAMLVPRNLDEIDKQRALAKVREPVDPRPRWNDYPTVWFSDRSDPKTAQRVGLDNLSSGHGPPPGAHADSATVGLGPGYAVKRMEIRIVDEPVSSGIESRLPWLAALVQRGRFTYLDGWEGGRTTRRDDPPVTRLFVQHLKRSA